MSETTVPFSFFQMEHIAVLSVATVVLAILVGMFFLQRRSITTGSISDKNKRAAAVPSSTTKKNKKKQAKKQQASKQPAAATEKKNRNLPSKTQKEETPLPAAAAAETTGGGKKKKKKKGKKKSAVAQEPPPKKEEEPVVKEEEEDDDDDEEVDAARLLQMSGTNVSKKKKKKKTKAKQQDQEQQPAVAAAASSPTKTAAASAPVAAAAATQQQQSDDWPQETVPNEEEEDDEWETVATKQTSSSNKQQVILSSTTTTDNINGSSGSPSIVLSIGSNPSIIIGPKGSTIKSLETQTNARFDILKEGGTNHTVRITGTEAEIAHAMELVQQILTDEQERQAKQVSIVLDLGSDSVKAVIGRGGATIQQIQTKTGTSLDAKVQEGTVTVKGEQDAVDAAIILCNNAAYGEAQDVIELGSRGMVNVVYGVGYAKIHELQDKTGAKLDIARGTTTLKISGSREAVVMAKKMVEELMAYNKGIKMYLDQSKVGAVYGKAGTNIRSIQDRTGTFIEVDSAGAGGGVVTCSIMGEPSAVESARKLVQMAIDGETELKPGEIKESLNLGVATSAVIGRGGSRVMELEKQHGVNIDVNSESGTCSIIGKEKAVQSAKAAIEEIAKPLLEAEKAVQLADRAVDQGASCWQPDNGTGLENDADGW